MQLFFLVAEERLKNALLARFKKIQNKEDVLNFPDRLISSTREKLSKASNLTNR